MLGDPLEVVQGELLQRDAVSLSLVALAMCGAVALPVAGLAQSGPLADPTRAPFAVPRGAGANQAPTGINPTTAAMLRQAGVPAGALPSEAAVDAPVRAAAPAAAAKPRHRLTSVMLGAGAGRSVAIIDGEVYRVGDKVQGAVLTGIDARGVVLGNGKASTRLSLFARPPEAAPSAPAADKDPASAASHDQNQGQPVAASMAPAPFPSSQNGARPDKDKP